jgi:hypothetical protein
MSDLPPEIDTSRPHPARVYDALIGGTSNFAVDRETVARVLEKSPNARIAPRENRSFLGRAVRFLTAEAGLRQFLDIGSGLPTANSVHQVAQAIEPSSRIVYVDNDPLVLVHARALLTSAPGGRTAYIQADARDPEAIVTAPAALELLDFSQPVGLLLVGLLHLLADADSPAEIVPPDHGARPGADGGRAGGDARRRDHHAKARLGRLRRDGLHRPRACPAGRGAGVGVAADGRLAPSGAGRGEHLRRGRAQALRRSPEPSSRKRLGLRRSSGLGSLCGGARRR